MFHSSIFSHLHTSQWSHSQAFDTSNCRLKTRGGKHLGMELGYQMCASVHGAIIVGCAHLGTVVHTLWHYLFSCLGEHSEPQLKWSKWKSVYIYIYIYIHYGNAVPLLSFTLTKYLYHISLKGIRRPNAIPGMLQGFRTPSGMVTHCARTQYHVAVFIMFKGFFSVSDNHSVC